MIFSRFYNCLLTNPGAHLTSNVQTAQKMKKLFIFLPLLALLLAACSKKDYIPLEVNVNEWMRTHDHGIVAYVDYETGNYIVESFSGYSVIEPWENVTPVENDHEYAYFNNRGVQTIYNRSGNYFTKARIVDSWLSWSEAMYVLDELYYNSSHGF